MAELIKLHPHYDNCESMEDIKDNAPSNLTDTESSGYPKWVVEGKANQLGIDEKEFCEEFLQENPIRCIHGRLYTVDGIADVESIRREVRNWILPYTQSNFKKRINGIIETMRVLADSEPSELKCDRVNVANGTYFLEDGRFSSEKTFCRNRLTVEYKSDAGEPTQWINFLNDLLTPEDITTLQEYLGYCLIPTTKAQVYLVLKGKGGEGKSQIGTVMKSIFGDSMCMDSIHDLEKSRFKAANLEDKLLMVDDDMDMNSLPKSNLIKSIVTCQDLITVERKCVQSYQAQIYSRFLCFSNGGLTAKNDNSDGFYRRQIVLTTKDRPADREDDPFLSEKMAEEKEGILLWMLEGLERLISNNYKLTVSERAKKNMEEVKKDSNNILSFLSSEGYILFSKGSQARTKDLYDRYVMWCRDNAEAPLTTRKFSGFLKDKAGAYGLKPDNHIKNESGINNRGYIGVKVA